MIILCTLTLDCCCCCSVVRSSLLVSFVVVGWRRFRSPALSVRVCVCVLSYTVCATLTVSNNKTLEFWRGPAIYESNEGGNSGARDDNAISAGLNVLLVNVAAVPVRPFSRLSRCPLNCPIIINFPGHRRLSGKRRGAEAHIRDK